MTGIYLTKEKKRMKKILIIGSLLVVLALVVGVAGVVYAQRGTPPTGQGMMGGSGYRMMGGRAAQSTQAPDGTTTNSYGYGMMGRRGGMGVGMMASGSYGPMHDYMVAALATQIGMTPEDLQAQIDGGKIPYQILTDQGKTAAEIQTILQAAHDEALKQAVAAGAITQDQADWMDSHMEQMWQNGFGPGSGGCMGGGRWQNQNPNQSNTTNQ
jgi:uncharacterized membrane protein